MKIQTNLYLTGEEYAEERAFWYAKLGLIGSGFRFQIGQAEREQGGHLRYHSFSPDARNTAVLEEISKGDDLALFTLLVSSFQYLFSSYSGQDTVCFATPLLGAVDGSDEINDLVPLILRTNDCSTVRDLIQGAKDTIAHSYSFQDFPVGYLGETHERSGFSNVLIMFPGLHRELSVDRSQFDLVIEVFRNPDIIFKLEFSTLFTETFLSSFAGHTNRFLNFLTNLSTPLADIDILSAEERHRILDVFNRTEFEFPENRTVLDVFREQVRLTPDGVATVYGFKYLTYRELDTKSCQLAHYIKQDLGLKAGSTVGVLCDRSEMAIIALLSILRCGCVYVPINTDFPEEKIRYVVTNSEIKALLIHSDYMTRLSGFYHIPMFALDFQLRALEDGVAFAFDVKPDDAAYLIYTSGSTGLPKGVLVGHRGLLNVALEHIKKLDMTLQDRYLQFMAPSFDGSLLDIFSTILCGATLVLTNKETISDGDVFARYVERNRVSIFTVTPSYLSSILRHALPTVRTLISAGEAAKPEAVLHYAQTKHFFNGYGPTETTVNATLYKVDSSNVPKRIPIGKPGANKQIYILDNLLRVQPAEVFGEIFVGGMGLAFGYYHDEALTSEKFIANPFGKSEKMYRTGDIGRWLADGNIEFLGRKDDQVKIRGFRVGLAEVEDAIRGQIGIKDVVVSVGERSEGDCYLTAHYVTVDNMQAAQLRILLERVLPFHMIPSYMMPVESFPLTPHGKVDKRALPDVTAYVQPDTYAAPRTRMERGIAAIFEKVLNRPRISIDDNFFNVGGHSLQATQIAARIQKELNVDLTVKDLFLHPVVSDLARHIEGAQTSNYQAIPRVAEGTFYELSHAQKRMWVLSTLQNVGSAYTICHAVIFEGNLKIGAFVAAIGNIFQRHDSLRTVFVPQGDDVFQRVIPYDTNTSIVDLLDIRAEEPTLSELQQYVSESAQIIFDLEQGPLFNVRLIQFSDDKHLFIFAVHHILFDGWSTQILINELSDLYRANLVDEPVAIQPLSIQYADFSAWQNTLFKSGVLDEARAYWLHKFSGELPVLDIPTDFQRPHMKTYRGDVVEISLGRGIKRGVDDITAETGTSAFMVMLAVLKVLLYRYTGQKDIVVGAPVSGRDHVDLEGQIGLYLNTLALRTQFSGSDLFVDILNSVKGTTLEAFEYQQYPFDRLIEDLSIPLNFGRAPLFDVMIVFQDTDFVSHQTQGWHGVVVNEIAMPSVISKFDLTFSFAERGDAIVLAIEFNTDLFLRSSVIRMAHHFERIVSSVSLHADTRIDEIDFLTTAETEQLLFQFNLPVRALPEATFVDLFGGICAARPDSVAVRFKDTMLTYGELNGKAETVAACLRIGYGVKPGDVVSLLAERSDWMIAAIVGIMKTGATLLLLDIESPGERLVYMLENARAQLLITDAHHGLPEGYCAVQVVERNHLSESIDPAKGMFKIDGNAPAYILYTSGSTGKPKGVQVGHASFLNYLRWANAYYFGDGNGFTFSFSTSPAFDLTFTSIFTTLLRGDDIYVHADVNIDALLVDMFSAESPVNTVKLTPSHIKMLELLPIYESNVEVVILGGEPVSEANVETLRRLNPHVRIYNEYGPTEATVGCMVKALDDVQSIQSIGSPIANARILILDENLRLVPTGIVGEICIAGVPLAQGYIGDDISMGRFTTVSVSGFTERIYRSGDLGKWFEDGEVAYCGRKDNQIKVRGHRVELSEVEDVLLRAPAIHTAVVIPDADDAGEVYLKAFLVLKPEATAMNWRGYLKQFLPEPMIPSVFIVLNEMPLTLNGKVDRRMLGDLAIEQAETPISKSPLTGTQARLIEIWKQILNQPHIGPADDLLTVGGNSLQMVRILAAVFREFGIRIDLRTLFLYSSVESLATLIEQSSSERYIQIPAVPLQEYYTLSHAQLRIWTASELSGEPAQFNVPSAYILEGALDTSAFESAWQRVITRHESLRTIFIKVDGMPKQKIRTPDETHFQIKFVDLTSERDHGLSYQHYLKEEALIPFDLNDDVLIRATLLRTGPDRHIFILTLHHIVCDGWSLNILTREVLTAYNALRVGLPDLLPVLPIQYKDYAVWQVSQMSGESFGHDRDYWKTKLSGTLTPVRFSNEVKQNGPLDGGKVNFRMSQYLLNGVKRMAAKQGTSLYTVFVAVVNVLLYKYTWQNDILLGTAEAGRGHRDLEGVVGFFINVLILRSRMDGTTRFSDFLRSTHEEVTESLAHAAYPYDLIVNDLNRAHGIGHSDIIRVGFTWNMFDTVDIDRDAGLIIRPLDVPVNITKSDLWFYGEAYDNRVEWTIEYNTQVFDRASVQLMAERFQHVLKLILRNPDLDIDAIVLLENRPDVSEVAPALEQAFDFNVKWNDSI